MLDILCSCFIFSFFVLPCIANNSSLGALRVFNSTKDFNTTFPGASIINTNHALEDFVDCYRQAAPRERQLSPTNFIDCFNAENGLATYDSHRPIHFRRNNDSAFILPQSFAYRTCVILIDMASDDAEDFFYVRQIRDVAIDTARKCCARPQALGGKGIVGPKKLMEVFVLGRM